MGDKYVPSIRDQKASERYQRQARSGSKFMKSTPAPSQKAAPPKPAPAAPKTSPAPSPHPHERTAPGR
jgi:hypothetical protein